MKLYLGFLHAVCHNNVIENGSWFYLPQIKTNCSNIVINVQIIIWSVVWIIDFWMDPFALKKEIYNELKNEKIIPKMIMLY